MLGLCLSSEGHHERALRELEGRVRINPSFALAHSIYGWALAQTGNLMKQWRRPERLSA